MQDAAGPSKVWDYSGPPFNLGFDSESQEKDEMANSQPQEAHVHVQAQPEEVQQDQDVHVPPHSQLARNEERPYENVGQVVEFFLFSFPPPICFIRVPYLLFLPFFCAANYYAKARAVFCK